MDIVIRIADYQNPQDAEALVSALDHYAKDPMGGGEGLKASTKKNLVANLAQTPNAFSILAFVDNKIAGLTNCFQAFSTFKCQPIINIHDLAVLAEYRGMGLSQKMISVVETIAQERNACKLTLEVLEGNKIAQNAYLKYGFAGYELDPTMGKAMFWEKPL